MDYFHHFLFTNNLLFIQCKRKANVKSLYPLLIHFSSVVQSCLTRCDTMNCSTPGLPVHHQLLEFTQTHPTISSSVIPFSSHLQSFPTSGSFQISQFFTSGGQSIGVSASASVLAVQGTFKSLFQHHSSKASILRHSALDIYN